MPGRERSQAQKNGAVGERKKERRGGCWERKLGPVVEETGLLEEEAERDREERRRRGKGSLLGRTRERQWGVGGGEVACWGGSTGVERDPPTTAFARGGESLMDARRERERERRTAARREEVHRRWPLHAEEDRHTKRIPRRGDDGWGFQVLFLEGNSVYFDVVGKSKI